jgi:hypothetical protein
MTNLFKHLALVVLLAGPVAAGDDAATGPWVEFELENGIHVSLLHAELASQQALFSFLPLGLLDDAAERAQYAHLVEHLMIRSTDPVELELEGMLLNGETTALALRLESFSDLTNWREALDRHVRWLQAGTVDAETLAREQTLIESEEQQTASRGYTHKWALAAWNQVVRHGAQHVAIHGDVAEATAESSLAYLSDRVRVGPGVRFVSVGPLPLGEAREAIEKALSVFEGEPWAVSVPSLPPKAVRAVRQTVATWDLPGRHYLEWYPVPDESALDRVSADALALLLNIKMQQRGGLQAVGVLASANADLVTPEGRWVLITASLPAGVDPAMVQMEMKTVIESLGAGLEATSVVTQLTTQLTELPDFAQVRKGSKGNPQAKWIEAQQAIFMIYAQMNMGLGLEELRAVYPRLTASDLVTFGATVMDVDKRSTLLLEPAD